MPEIVGIKESDKSTSRCSDPGIARGGGATVFRVPDKPYVGEARIFLDKRQIVGRTVIDDDNFIVFEILCKNAVQGAPYDLGPVEYGDDDADQWR